MKTGAGTSDAAKTAAVILAGGASRRMGCPKALLLYSEETFLDRLIGLFEPVCSQVIVVLGYHAAAIRSGIVRSAQFVENPRPECGQLSSLQCGFSALADGVVRVFFTPVDYPGIRGETIRSIAMENAAVVVPEYRGRHGHPVLVGRKVADQILALGSGQTARDVIHRHIEYTRYIDVDDPGILLDVDDPEAYQALTQVVI